MTHLDLIEDIAHPVRHLGFLESIAVRELANGHDEPVPRLFLQGSKQSIAIDVSDGKFVADLRDAATELESLQIKNEMETNSGGVSR